MDFTNLDNEINKVNKDLAAEIRQLSPVDTGRLKNSIRAERPIETQAGIVAPISLLSYYVFPDLGTKFQRAQKFVERAQTNIINQEIQDIANAAAEDVANELDRVLPDTITLTLDS